MTRTEAWYSGAYKQPTDYELTAVIMAHPSAVHRWITVGQDDLTFHEWAERKAKSWLAGGAGVRSQSDCDFEQDVIRLWRDHTETT
jgi:hypothetical protein